LFSPTLAIVCAAKNLNRIFLIALQIIINMNLFADLFEVDVGDFLGEGTDCEQKQKA
jgi:hypothetical protein